MSSKSPEIKGRPNPIEKKPQKQASDSLKRAIGKTAVNGKK